MDRTLFGFAARAVAKKWSEQALNRGARYFFPTRGYYFKEGRRYFTELSQTICSREHIDETLKTDYVKIVLYEQLNMMVDFYNYFPENRIPPATPRPEITLRRLAAEVVVVARPIFENELTEECSSALIDDVFEWIHPSFRYVSQITAEIFVGRLGVPRAFYQDVSDFLVEWALHPAFNALANDDFANF